MCLAGDALCVHLGMLLAFFPCSISGLVPFCLGIHNKYSSSPKKAAPYLGAPSSVHAGCSSCLLQGTPCPLPSSPNPVLALYHFGICRKLKKTFSA